MRLWASTAQPSHAPLAKNRPDGQCSSPAPSFEVADGELDGAMVAVELIDLDGREFWFDVGDERVVPPVGTQSTLGGLAEAGASHHEPRLASGRLVAPPPVR
jgi:hypothetical protein